MKSFHVYRSSAGSGKTFTLVKEYLGIVLKNPKIFRNILAVTFTNKAANEMRERIIRNLTEISEPDKYSDSNAVENMLPALEKETSLDRSTLVKNASHVLKNILHNYHDFAVGTIDSFIHRVVRSFAFDLHLPLNLEVETEEDVMVSQAVDVLLSRVGVDDEPTKALLGFARSRIEDEKNWDIERDLKKFSKNLLRDNIVKFLPDLHRMKSADILSVSKKLNSWCRKFEKEISAQAAEMVKIVESNGLSLTDFSSGKSGWYGYILKLYRHDFSGLDTNSNFLKAIENDTWYPQRLEAGRKELIDSLSTELGSIRNRINEYISANKEQFKAYSILKRNIFQLAVLNEIEKILDQIRENDAVIHISELDKRIADVVNHEPVPFIYERLGEKYQHYLIDEFQDTSVLEWQNILPLVENALASENMSMLVGDGKQAIYRFKGGEVAQLAMLPKIYEKPDRPEMHEREMSLERNFDDKPLDKNFRSHDEIINFNNRLYGFLKGLLPDDIQLIYKDYEQKIGKSKPGGEVRIMFVDAEGNKTDKEPEYYSRILSTIRNLKDNLGYTYRDIAILCRSNGEASKIARKLLGENIDVVSAESLLLTSSPEVNFLIHCLDYLANNEDKAALAGMLGFISGRFEDSSLNDMLTNEPSMEKTDALIAYLEEHGISFKLAELVQMGLYERVESLIREFKLHDTPDPYLFFFLDVVHNYLMNKRFVPEDFTEFWRENRQRFSIVVPEGMNAVKVMTIHKAKGLEFPVVIYPFANSRAEIRNEQKWVHLDDKNLPELTTALLPLTKAMEGTPFEGVYNEELSLQQLDLLNILYVATTRPTEKLYILCDKPKKAAEKVSSIPEMLRAFLENENSWDDSRDEYYIGMIDEEATVESKDESAVHPGSFISGDWRESIVLSGHAEDYWDLDDEARNIEWGNQVHKILSNIDTVADIDEAIQMEVNTGKLSNEKRENLKELLLSILTDNKLEAFFDGNYQLHNEAAIMRSDGKEYRPDRLMIKDGVAVVVDYKTGKAEPKYARQLELYGLLLEEMGYTEVEKYLLYIDEPYILEKI